MSAVVTQEPTKFLGFLHPDGKECAGQNYSRWTVHNEYGTWERLESGRWINVVGLVFPRAHSDWGKFAWVAVFDAKIGGRMLCKYKLRRAIHVGFWDGVSIGARQVLLDMPEWDAPPPATDGEKK